MKLESGHEVVPLEDDEKAKLAKDFRVFRERDMMRLYPGKLLLPMRFLKFANRIYNFELRKSDVVILTYPKCGTTWTQEIVWTMRNSPNLDHPWASRSPLSRSPFLEFDMVLDHPGPNTSSSKNLILESFMELCPGKDPRDGINIQLAEAVPDPRTIKTHLPFSLMPPSMLDTAKVVFVARNPRDVIVSYHHHCKIMDMIDYVGTFEDFVQYFVDDTLLWGPYGLYLKEAWERRHHPNLHIVFFEDLKANPVSELQKLNVFLETNLKQSQLEAIVKHASFANMKEMEGNRQKDMPRGVSTDAEGIDRQRRKKEYVEKEGTFFRKGEVGDWKNRLTPELSSKVDHWINENITKLGIDFRHIV